MITIDSFGQSGTEADLREALGFNAQAIAKKIQNKISLNLAWSNARMLAKYKKKNLNFEEYYLKKYLSAFEWNSNN